MTAINKEYCSQLHDVIFAFVRKQRFVGLEHAIPAEEIGGGLGHTEESILFILFAEPNKNVKALSEEMHLERSWMSRVVAGLEKRGLLHSITPESDKRSKQISLTKKGEKLLLKVEREFEKIIKECLSPISNAEQNRFEKYIKKLADGLGAKHYNNNSSSHPIAYQLGRLSAGFGMYAEKLFGAALTVTQLHCLLILEQRQTQESQVNDIYALLPFDMSTVSRTLAAFEKYKWIDKKQSQQDKRSFSISLNRTGREALASHRQRATDTLREALRDFTVKQRDDFLHLYQVVSSNIPYRRKENAPFRIRELAPERQETKRFEESLFPAVKSVSEKTLGVFENNDLRAVIEISKNVKKSGVFRIQICADGIQEQEIVPLLQTCLANK